MEYLLKGGFEVVSVYFTHAVEYSGTISYENFLQIGGRIEAVIFAGGNSNHNIENKHLFESNRKRQQIYTRNFSS